MRVKTRKPKSRKLGKVRKARVRSAVPTTDVAEAQARLQIDLIEVARRALDISRLYLVRGLFELPSILPDKKQYEIIQQTKRSVQFERQTSPDGTSLLTVRICLGVRIVDAKELEAAVYAVIEADFAVEYAIKSSVDDDALAAFANLNSVHNVWPFWRQHVFDIVQRGHLPQISVPLFAGVKLGALRDRS